MSNARSSVDPAGAPCDTSGASIALVYFSASSNNTARFVSRFASERQTVRLNARSKTDVGFPFVLVTPTYNGRTPRPVIEFLNNPDNRQWIRGVISGGNTNFGPDFAAAGRTISTKCDVPHLHAFELTGTERDITITRQHLEHLSLTTSQ